MSGMHTKGPWKAAGPFKNYNGAYDLWEIHWSDEGECVAETVHGEANARLIAAAPCLLEALQTVLNSVPTPTKYHSLQYTKAVEAADAAISRATGETGA